MLDVLCSYKETKKQTLSLKKHLEDRRDSLIACGKKAEADNISNEISIVNAMLSDVTFIIEWLSKGRMPGAIRGIERQSVYKREVPFEGKWLDLMIDKQVEIYKPDLPDEEVEDMKKELVNDLKQYLTPKQQEVFNMLAQGIDRADIASMLGVSRQAVHEMIVRGKRSIKEAGWMMV